MIFMNKPTWKEQEEKRIAERDAEIRKACDDLRRKGKKPNYAEIARNYGLTREWVRRIDQER